MIPAGKFERIKNNDILLEERRGKVNQWDIRQNPG
jgi:hypothetical protein